MIVVFLFIKKTILLGMTKIKPSGLVSFFVHLILQLTKMSQKGNMHKKMLVLFLKPVIELLQSFIVSSRITAPKN